MSYSFSITDAWLKEQTTDAPLTLFRKGVDLYAALKSAIEADGWKDSEATQAAGAFGGLCKRFHAGLLQSITKDIIRMTGMDTSRQRIVDLQRDIFGRAQASKDLKTYAHMIRFGGGRAEPMPVIHDDLKLAAKAKFDHHLDDLKIAVQASVS